MRQLRRRRPDRGRAGHGAPAEARSRLPGGPRADTRERGSQGAVGSSPEWGRNGCERAAGSPGTPRAGGGVRAAPPAAHGQRGAAGGVRRAPRGARRAAAGAPADASPAGARRRALGARPHAQAAARRRRPPESPRAQQEDAGGAPPAAPNSRRLPTRRLARGSLRPRSSVQAGETPSPHSVFRCVFVQIKRLRQQHTADERVGRVSAGTRGGLTARSGRAGRRALTHGGAHVGGRHAASRLAALGRWLAPTAAAAAIRQPLQPAFAKLLRSPRSGREDARAAVPHQQMRPAPRYPVDRYLVESSNKIEMVNIIDDEIWNPEPALRPEEEIMLRKLHDMLQSTADDLKLLSGELARSREPAAQARPAPAPFDEEFNEKVHIEQVVNAKFHGYKIIDKTPLKAKPKVNKPQTNVLNTGVQANITTINHKPTVAKRLTKSRTNIVQINEMKTKENKVNEVTKPIKESVAYNEFAFEYPEPKVHSPVKGFQVQVMPSINIRSELKEQKVLHLDIVPDSVNSIHKTEDKLNVAVIAMQHDEPPIQTTSIKIQKDHPLISIASKQPARKVTKMVTCESSTSTNNLSSDPPYSKASLIKNRVSPKKSSRLDKTKNNVTLKPDSSKRTHLNLEEWKKKLNSVYGQPSGSRKNQRSKGNTKRQPTKNSNIPSPQPLNNAQYIPYSKLTLGGVSVSDIEREISNIPDKSNIPLSPILDRIISSRENSQHNSPRKNTQRENSKILTTSDENLLQEVIDIEKTVSKTLSKNAKSKMKDAPITTSDSTDDDTNEPESYADDFEDDKSYKSDKHSPTEENINSPLHKNGRTEKTGIDIAQETTKDDKNAHNVTYSKVPNLSLKNGVDIFEYVHAIDTQDEATQSQTTNKISLKETQTSPRSGTPSVPIQPIHNDLWPSMDPSKKIEKMFTLEKDFIKKLIMDEYGDLLQKSIDKPSTSKENQESLNSGMNVAASQKVTQTSPKHVKSVMTSPYKTKTRTTSPFPQTLAVDHKTSPILFVTDEKDIKVETEQDPEDLGISINLSSPRFSLRLPNTSVEVLTNLEIRSRSPSNVDRKTDRHKENSVRKYHSAQNVIKKETSSTSVDPDNSSSDISSLGEIKLKKRHRKSRVSSPSPSESSSSSKLSVDLNSISILPLRSEGEVSLSHRARSRNASNLPSKSDGELSLGYR